jgi:hypothetical protein
VERQVKFYTGVGSRETPNDILKLMENIGEKLASQGWTLRSGGAVGADQAFERGMFKFAGYDQPYSWLPAEIYLPWSGYEDHYKDTHGGLNILPSHIKLEDERIAEGMAMAIHPAWEACKQGAKKMHTRNVFQVLGRTLDAPSKMLIAWTRLDNRGNPKGGTATAINLANENGVTTFNLNKPENFERINKWIGGL